YSSLSFWANGGAAGGQNLQVYLDLGTTSQPAYQLPGGLPANTWQQYNIPLSSLNGVNKSNLNRITFQRMNTGSSGTFYLDDIQLNSKPAPALVHLSVNAPKAFARPTHAGSGLIPRFGTATSIRPKPGHSCG